MATPKFTPEQAKATVDWLRANGYPGKTVADICRATGKSQATVGRHLRQFKDLGGEVTSTVLPKSQQFETAQIPDTDLPVEQMIEYRKLQYQQMHKAKQARKLINVRVKINGPIAVSHFGDPHVDDDGTDLAMIEHHAAIIRKTEGMFGANIGDTTNNWIGRLARLYGEQGTTAKQGWMLAEWFLKSVDWLYVITGNHDAWSGSGDPINYVLRGAPGASGGAQARLNLQFPGGREIRINARHNFPGNSMYNPAHGPNKAAMQGWRDHVLIAGHTHQTGYSLQKDPVSGLISHCIRIASYKVHDRYADELGLDDRSLGPNVVTILNPNARNEASIVHVLFDVEEGADYLTWLRKREGC